MDFTFTEDQQTIRDAVLQHCSQFGDDYWLDHDRSGEFPEEFYAAMAEAGWQALAALIAGADVLLQVGRRQALVHIEACMDKLPEVQRDALFWTYFQDERDHEVAERQGVNLGTVKSRLNAARQALKRCLGQRAAGGLHV